MRTILNAEEYIGTKYLVFAGIIREILPSVGTAGCVSVPWSHLPYLSASIL